MWFGCMGWRQDRNPFGLYFRLLENLKREAQCLTCGWIIVRQKKSLKEQEVTNLTLPGERAVTGVEVPCSTFTLSNGNRWRFQR